MLTIIALGVQRLKNSFAEIIMADGETVQVRKNSEIFLDNCRANKVVTRIGHCVKFGNRVKCLLSPNSTSQLWKEVDFRVKPLNTFIEYQP